MDRYKIVGRIGQGAHGFVMKGLDRYNERHVALKKLVIKNLDEGIPKNILREITTLRVLNHDNIVKLNDVVPHGMGLILVMEFLPSNLHLMMQVLKEALDLSLIKAYLWMLLEGVMYMHENHIMHRDLKPTNLLISAEGTLKIGDFGLARIYVESEPERLYSHQVATRWYRAPELLYGARKYTKAVDMWAVGCIAAEMINRAPLFPGETDIEQLAMVLHTLGTPTKETWPGLTQLPDYNKITFARNAGSSWSTILPKASSECRHFVKSFVMYDQDRRMTAKSALHHKFFNEKPLACRLTELPSGNITTEKENNIDVEMILGAFDEVLQDF